MATAIVLVIDFGSQYTHLIARRIRDIHVQAKVLSASSQLATIQSYSPKLIILSGGPSSVHLDGSPTLPDGFVEYIQKNEVSILGICYGMHLIVKLMGGVVMRAERQEFGHMEIAVVQTSRLFGEVESGHNLQVVWMSHGDEVVELPPGFNVVATSAQGNIAAIENTKANVYALQYHPEVTHTKKGMETLQHLVLDICGIAANWQLENVLTREIEAVRNTIGPDDHVICGLSGGVDSIVAATMVYRAIGDRLHCVFVDNGLCRYKERERLTTIFERELHFPVNCVNATEQFLRKLKGVEDPEKKRKIVGAEFFTVFEDFSHQVGKNVGKEPAFLVQGTLYPDVIESFSDSGNMNSHPIKSHHNVGGLPSNMKFKLVEPLKSLFKDEVRELGKMLNVPEYFLKRHPYPGPGLAVRIVGDVLRDNALETIRLVDEIFLNKIQEAGLYDQIWQAFAVYLPMKTVGVQGDERTFSNAVALRAITSEDGMTANWYHFDAKFLASVSSEICNTVRGINRVVYDITSKPPSTIEWE